MPIKHRVYKEDYAWKSSRLACEYDNHCDIQEYFKNFTCLKKFIGNLVFTCDKIVALAPFS